MNILKNNNLIAHFRSMNFLVCELYLHEDVCKKTCSKYVRPNVFDDTELNLLSSYLFHTRDVLVFILCSESLIENYFLGYNIQCMSSE